MLEGRRPFYARHDKRGSVNKKLEILERLEGLEQLEMLEMLENKLFI